jgi:LuxR family transcriptional regulator, maltose regulon positive regulatory protein
MDSSDVLQEPSQARPTGGPAFDLLLSKLRCPSVRPGTVRRSSLIDRLARQDLRPIVSVVAPGGYGKTTLLSQWTESNGQAVAWVSVDEGDNDPRVLLTYVAAALDTVQPVGQRVFDALASPVSSVPGSVVPRLGAALAAMTSPVVLVVDDVHLLRNSECRAALSVLADHVPAGSRLVFAGRDEPPLQVARLRVEGKITEIGPADLSLNRAEAAALLRAAEVALDDADVAELHQQTEGWAAGLYLAALAIREGGVPGGAGGSFSGADVFVTEYVESEFLARISDPHRVFLTRTAVLERMSGPLCEAVLELPGSGATLAELARSNLLLVPLDRRGQWYRYHHLFRDILLAQLERLEPGLIRVLRRRAAAWCWQNDLPEEALEYSMAAGDVEAAAQLVEKLWRSLDKQGRVTTLQRWIRWLDEHGGIEGHPQIAVWASVLGKLTGRPAEAERWAEVVDRWQYQDPPPPADPATEAFAAMLRAYLCRRGLEQMRADADEAARKAAAAGIVAPAMGLLQGIVHILSGDLDGGDAFFEEAFSTAQAAGLGGPDAFAQLLCERSLVAIARNRWSQAGAFARQAHAVLRQARLEDSYTSPLVCAVQARVALHHGDIPAARQELLGAQRLRPLLTYAIPHVAVQARIELIRVHLALADLAGARTLMREVDELLRQRPGLGTLVGEAKALRARLDRQRGTSSPGASALTAAELRLVPMLSTHLQLHEIAADMYLSPHTIRAHSKSIYRKLGANSRSQAVARARELGLLEG